MIFQFLKHKCFLGAIAGMMALGMTIADADAKRLGGGRNIGKQWNNVTQRQQTPRKPTQATPRQTSGASGAAQSTRNRWIAPIAGLAAGFGIATLLSHLGLGGAFASVIANIIMIALIGFVAIWLIRFLKSRFSSQQFSYPGTLRREGGNRQPALRQVLDSNKALSSIPDYAGSIVEGGQVGTCSLGVSNDFDIESFLRHAKVNFVRMQTAWDAGKLSDIHEFTTPQMFAEIRLDFDERGDEVNRTDIVKLDAEMLGIDEIDGEYRASIRFSGLLRESENSGAAPFAEVWSLTKPQQGNSGWLLAAIEQAQ
ncbi:Tim44 domain-containing protein [Candidatus Pandoraea novymonadis]|uniref:Tim44-like domain-containing protein n=1 Tax=Candidatus Pandoraea novymonadis TaxID=1808959 RepID=A0ABX5FF45_9BURK|nr:TIM44-like domain-containing protein [Candidatus Pandoraea novymonadis]PSB92331.1 hypothetical protein BZL35_00571 [Candidatus Pandoraea novymonadis]